MWASKLGHVEVVQELILSGANVNAQTKVRNSYTIMGISSCCSGHTAGNHIFLCKIYQWFYFIVSALN